MFIFNGDGFSENPLTGEELKKLRHMQNEVTKAWPFLSHLVTVASAVSIINNVLKVVIPVMAAAAIIGAYLKTQGVI